MGRTANGEMVYLTGKAISTIRMEATTRGIFRKAFPTGKEDLSVHKVGFTKDKSKNNKQKELDTSCTKESDTNMRDLGPAIFQTEKARNSGAKDSSK